MHDFEASVNPNGLSLAAINLCSWCDLKQELI